MDYVLGSVAALITGNVTPNRPRLIKRALTPTKHQASPNVTPKSEFVEDRSIFLSPSMQKKKAIVKKSPKRIFQNPDLETTANEGDLSVNSPKAEKVKKHLKDDLDNEGAANKSVLTPKSPKNKDKNRKESVSSQDDTQNLSVQDNNESTPKKKKRKRVSESELTASPKTESVVSEPPKTPGKSPKKMKQRRKSTAEPDSNKENDSTDMDNVPEIKTNTEVIKDSIEKPEIKSNINPSPKKKNKKRKKKAKGQNNQKTESNEIVPKDKEVSAEDNKTKSPKKNNKKQKKNNQQNKPDPVENVPKPPPTEDPEDDSDEESTDFLNPNAITEKDSDSEHDSDDEIESENEEINKKVLEVGPAESSDDEEEEPAKKAAKPEKKKDEKETQQEKGEGVTEEELKRTLFVGNVPFSNKCKKEIKKIFSKHGQIETVRIRTVPVKDGRYTPKLALIKNELHPERSTVNVYVKFTDPDSVEKALVENNTVLNDHHLRVSRSSSTGAEHDPKCSIFVGNMPFAMEDEALREKFEKCGEIDSVRIIRDKKTNAGKGFGYVNFKSKDGVELALALTEEDLTIKNRILRVKRCTQVTNKQKATPSRNNQKSPAQGGFNRGKPGFNTGKPGFNTGKPGFNTGKPGFNRGKPGFNTGKPGFNRGKPDFYKGKPDFNRGKPDFNRGQPDFNRGKPDFNRGKPDFNRGRPGQDGDVQGFNKFIPRGQGNEQQGQDGAHRRILHKRKFQEGGDGPPSKVQKNINQPNKEKKPRKEFVGMTAEKKKKPNKFNKSQKKKKAISEILTK